MSTRIPLGEYFVKSGKITREDLQTALELQKQRGGFLGQILVTEGWISEHALCKTLSKAINIQWATIDCLLIDQEVLDLVPKSMAVTFNVLPIFIHRNILYLAMEDPADMSIVQFVEFKAGMRVKPLLAPLQQLRSMIKKYYHENSLFTRLPSTNSAG